MRMEQKRFEFVLQAVQSVSHGSETHGNITSILRRKVRGPAGEWFFVPQISGNSMRHGLRSAYAYAHMDAAGLLNDPCLDRGALRLFFTGGMMTGRGDTSIVKLDQYREFADLFPGISLLGGCANNRTMPGKGFVVEPAWLICDETRHILPDWAVAYAEQLGPIDSCRQHVELVSHYTMDPELDTEKRLLLSQAAQDDVYAQLGQSEAAHDDDIETAREATKFDMMPHSFEAIAAGSLFFWGVQVTCYSDLDVDAFMVMVAAYLADCRIGGKSRYGYGKVRPLTARGVVLNRPSEKLHPMDTTELATKAGTLFRSHVSERRERIRSFLTGVNA